MALKRYKAIKDNTITNAFEANLETRGTGSNSGLADSMAVFSIFGQASSTSHETSRFLVQFPVSSSDGSNTILADRLAGKIPPSGSVDFFLRVFNVATPQTLPRDFTLEVDTVALPWEEGYGVDLDEYKDQTYNGTGSNWINRMAHVPWLAEGGDFPASSSATGIQSPTLDQTFDLGTENLTLNITKWVEAWIKGYAGGEYNNNGIIVHLTPSQEGGNRSYYTKHFSARGSEYFFKRPIIEAQWDNTRKDQRGLFYVSSSALSAADNLNTIYFYNYFRGELTDVAGVGAGDEIYVNLYKRRKEKPYTHVPSPLRNIFFQLPTAPQTPVTGGWVSTGIYSASFALDTNSEIVYDRWWKGNPGDVITDPNVIVYQTGTINPIRFHPSEIVDTQEHITAMTNLRNEYANNDIARLRVYTRLKGWNPTIYTVATAGIQNHIVEDSYYRVFRVVDDYDVISYGTGSLNHTRLSYDASGSYFDLDMSMLEIGFEYGIRFSFYINGTFDEYNHTYKFKVIE